MNYIVDQLDYFLIEFIINTFPKRQKERKKNPQISQRIHILSFRIIILGNEEFSTKKIKNQMNMRHVNRRKKPEVKLCTIF